jgi:hypothetical protein
LYSESELSRICKSTKHQSNLHSLRNKAEYRCWEKRGDGAPTHQYSSVRRVLWNPDLVPQRNPDSEYCQCINASFVIAFNSTFYAFEFCLYLIKTLSLVAPVPIFSSEKSWGFPVSSWSFTHMSGSFIYLFSNHCSFKPASSPHRPSVLL